MNRPPPLRHAHQAPFPRHRPAAGRLPPGWRWLAAAGAMATLVGLGGLTACGTPPAPQLFSLLPPATALGGAPSPAPAPAGPSALPPLAVAVGPVVVPLPVDQPQWLVHWPDQRLVLLEQALWASPLRDEVRAALRDHLARRWAATDGQPPAWRLALVLSRFDSALGREARLEGRWTLQPGAAPSAAGTGAGADPGATPLSCPLLIREPAGAGLPALADAHRRALARLADQIGAALRRPPGATESVCAPADR